MIPPSPARVINLSFFHPFVPVPSPVARIERARASRRARLVPARVVVAALADGRSFDERS